MKQKLQIKEDNLDKKEINGDFKLLNPNWENLSELMEYVEQQARLRVKKILVFSPDTSVVAEILISFGQYHKKHIYIELYLLLLIYMAKKSFKKISTSDLIKLKNELYVEAIKNSNKSKMDEFIATCIELGDFKKRPLLKGQPFRVKGKPYYLHYASSLSLDKLGWAEELARGEITYTEIPPQKEIQQGAGYMRELPPKLSGYLALLLTTKENKPISHVTASQNGVFCYLANGVTAKEFRGKGVFTVLYQEIIKQAKQFWPKTEYFVGIERPNNLAIIELGKKIGFEQVSDKKKIKKIATAVGASDVEDIVAGEWLVFIKEV